MSCTNLPSEVGQGGRKEKRGVDAMVLVWHLPPAHPRFCFLLLLLFPIIIMIMIISIIHKLLFVYFFL